MKSTLPRRRIKNAEQFIYNGIMVPDSSVERMIKEFTVIDRRDKKEGVHSVELKK